MVSQVIFTVIAAQLGVSQHNPEGPAVVMLGSASQADSYWEDTSIKMVSLVSAEGPRVAEWLL